MKTDKKSVDTGKVLALQSAGWKTARIAAEMGVTDETVEEIVRKHAGTGGQEQDGIGDQEKRDHQDGKIIVLTDGELQKIYEKAAEIGSREALKMFRQEQKKEYVGRADRRLRNTKLLLRNYHMLREHAKRSVFGRTQMEESALDILESMMSMYDNEVIIESIRRSATRTAVIVSHIETMFGLYYSYCERSVKKELDMRRYNVVWDMYMAEDILSVKETADKYNISTDSVYSDVRVGVERLSALIFGVDGLNVR